MLAGGLLSIVIPQAWAADWAFQERKSTGPGTDTLEALERFWSRPEVAPVAPELGLPHESWEEIFGCLERLSDPSLQGDRMASWAPMPAPGEERWLDVARLADELLISEDPLAAAVAALYPIAAWEGALGGNLYAQPWQGHHWGWHVFPLVLGRALLAADAIWTARSVVERAHGFIENAKGFPVDETLNTFLAPYVELEGSIDKRFSTCAANLAWDLRAALTPDGPNFRPEVAAMLWTLGDVPRAESVAADPSYVPPLHVVREVVEISLERLPVDPFLQYIWLELKDRPPLELRGHKALFGAINNVFHQTGTHEVENIGLSSPSRAYARMAVAHFAGPVDSEVAQEFREAGGMFEELVGTREPVDLFRLRALFNLTLVDDSKQQAAYWSDLADFASEIIWRTVRRGVFRSLHRCLDIPFAYLRAEAAADAVERHRCDALVYWLAVTTPRLPEDEAAASLLAEEQVLLRELRGARFIRLLPHLPGHYRRYGFEIGEALDKPIPEGAQELEDGGLMRFDPFDQELAKRQLDETWDRLDALWERMRGVTHDYAAERLEPYASAEAFQQALKPAPDVQTR